MFSQTHQNAIYFFLYNTYLYLKCIQSAIVYKRVFFFFFLYVSTQCENTGPETLGDTRHRRRQQYRIPFHYFTLLLLLFYFRVEKFEHRTVAAAETVTNDTAIIIITIRVSASASRRQYGIGNRRKYCTGIGYYTELLP